MRGRKKKNRDCVPAAAEVKQLDKPQADAEEMVPLNQKAIRKSLVLLERHWRGDK